MHDPKVTIVWNTSVPETTPVSVGIDTGLPGCSVSNFPFVKKEGDSFSANLSKMKACDQAISMQAMVNFNNGQFVACSTSAGMNIPLQGANQVIVKVNSFIYPVGPGASATCTVESPEK